MLDLATASEELRTYFVDLFAERAGFRWGITLRERRDLDRAGFVREALLPRHGHDEHGGLCDELLFARPSREA